MRFNFLCVLLLYNPALLIIDDMFKKMKLEALQDIEKLQSVIDIEEVSLRLVELVEVIQRQNVERHGGRILIINCWRRSINTKC